MNIKKLRPIIFIFTFSLLWSCSGSNKKVDKDTSEIRTADSLSIETEETATASFLTHEGIGKIKIEMACDSIPEKELGLYDLVINTQSDDAGIFRFLLEGRDMFYGYSFSDDKIDLLSLASEGAQASTANGPIGVGDPFLSLLNLPGMRAEWIASDDSGVWFWTAGGLWFGVKPDSASITLAEKLSSPERPPMASDFTENDLVGYIGTGLPF